MAVFTLQAELSVCGRLCGLQSLKYLLSGSLQRKFAIPCSKSMHQTASQYILFCKITQRPCVNSSTWIYVLTFLNIYFRICYLSCPPINPAVRGGSNLVLALLQLGDFAVERLGWALAFVLDLLLVSYLVLPPLLF